MILTVVVRVLIILMNYKTVFRNRLIELLEQFAIINESIFDEI